jgi:mono/diheme cytochrome c family protein
MRIALSITAFACCLLLSEWQVLVMADERSVADARTFKQTIRPLLVKHCVRCHGEKKQEAELRLDRLGPDLIAEKTADVWHELMNRVNLGEMPPKGQPRLAQAELIGLSEWTTGELQRVKTASQQLNGQVVMRRLNRSEYTNTIRNLVGINYEASKEFPADPSAYGFDNIGSALSVSPLQMEKYLRAARRVIDLAIASGDQPKRERWRFQAERRSKEDRGYYFENDAKFGNLGTTPNKQRGRYIAWTLGGGLDEFRTKGFEHLRPVDKTEFRTHVLRAIKFSYRQPGEYIIRVRAFGHYPRRKMSEHYLYGPPRLNVTSNGVRVATEDVTATADAPRVYETRFFTDAVTTTVFVRNRYEFSANLIGMDLGKRVNIRSPEFPMPYLAIDWYEIDGPVYDSWPPLSHTRILFPSKNRKNENVYAREVLEAFASRAFRRPARKEEVDALVAGFSRARPNKANFVEAIKVSLVAVLCSPRFLFLSEPQPAKENKARPLDDHEFASRLSYFLWSSMPDEELLALASAGKLKNDAVLETQITRMLKDSRSQALVENFTGQWLGLRKLGEVVPDDRRFPRYGEHLEESMADEARGFFAEILHNDLSVLNFIDSDFAMLNERLARFYEIKGVKGDRFRKVPLKPEHHRGGLLTQASMLTTTSNGTRTSPVKRGIWILENMLADPPPPPPPDAGEIPPPKTPGPRQATVRQRLAIHRSVPAYAACHAKIDPLGFALEHYDASGLYRTKESSRSHLNPHPQDPDVDARGELPDGRKFTGVEELKRLLLKEEDKFLDCLSKKLFVYAVGRGLTYTDRDTIEQLRESLKSDNYHLRGLITNIVKTKAFQSK